MQDQIWPTIVTLVGILAGAAVLVAWIIRPRETAAVLNAAQEFTAAIAAARDLVAAAEQMTQAGDMDPAARLDYVMDELGELYPALEAPQIRAAVEAAVFWINRLTEKQPEAPSA